MKIHRELIGSIPMVQHLRDSLDKIIQRYEASRLTEPEFGLMSKTDIKLYMDEARKDNRSMQRMVDAVAIELCAQHFYGLTSIDFNTFPDLIDAIKGMDDDLKVR
jgi:hypothetical protein